MKRDMDIVREILLQIESWGAGTRHAIEISGLSEMDTQQYLYLLHQAGLIDAINTAPNLYDPPKMIVARISWNGYEFLDNARSPEVWNEANSQVASTVGTVSLSVLTAVLIEVAKEKLGLI